MPGPDCGDGSGGMSMWSELLAFVLGTWLGIAIMACLAMAANKEERR